MKRVCAIAFGLIVAVLAPVVDARDSSDQPNGSDRSALRLEAIRTEGPPDLDSPLTPGPCSPKVVNLRDGSFSVVWGASNATVGYLVWGTAPGSLVNTACDVRDVTPPCDLVASTHFVEVSGLSPSSTYYVQIMTGGSPDGDVVQVRTGPVIPPPVPDTIYGQVFRPDGETFAVGTYVCATVRDADGAGSPDQGTTECGIIREGEDGYWSTSLGSARTLDLARSFAYSDVDDEVVEAACGGADGCYEQNVFTDSDAPSPTMVLADFCDHCVYCRDEDGDTYGDPVQTVTGACGAPPTGYVTNCGDCNDRSVDVRPGAPEICDGINNDCSDPAWPALPGAEADADQDGFSVCEGDCVDSNPLIRPGFPDRCNGVNDDCYDITPDGSGETWFDQPCDGTDADLCLEGRWTCTEAQRQCSDATGNSIEICNNGLDDDCDGIPDAQDPDCLVPPCPDADEDGYAVCAATCAATQPCGDCNDGNPAIHPGVADLCNGVDEDCDNAIDDGYVPTPTTCGLGVCAATGQMICENGATRNTCVAGPSTGPDTNCNGVDENCDGAADNAYVPTPTTCGLGVCASTGQMVCQSGATRNTCIAGPATGPDTDCNGVDEDCDGVADDGFVSTPTTCGVGACASTGSISCVSGQVRDSCRPGDPGSADLCNGADDNCNGLIDEDFVPQATICGVGACSSTGSTGCVGGQVQDSCRPGAPASDDATCNGVDDDCNGQVDEDYASQATSCGVGACASTGSTSCVSGQVQDSCRPGAPGSSDATCNGVDDDCNGQVDEDYASQATSCGVGACASTGSTSCVSGQVQDSCRPGAPGSSDVTCNGVDDDCNGQVDEDYASQATSCGVGACASTGSTSCVSGQVQDSCRPGAPGSSDATCNGVDDDCNGQVDEDYASQATSCGVGACASTGSTSCVSGQVQDSCRPGAPGSSDATCNGVDDDCNGQVDEDYASQATSCGVGACASTGSTSCVSGQVQDSCRPGAPGSSDATCNGVDDDCNGQVDEDYASQATSCGVGACASTGSTSCVSGQVQDSCRPGDPGATDLCNGVDDNCNGQIDEDFVPQATSCGVGACASTGSTSCVSGQVQDSCRPGTAASSDASCNGVDDDCNGAVDEDYVSRSTICGLGACASTGSTSCVSGQEQDSCRPGAPAPSDGSCNGVDDDCNGTVDEDYASQATSCGVGACASTGSTSCVTGQVRDSCIAGTPAPIDTCGNGVDDDCDGSIDEGCTQPCPDADQDGYAVCATACALPPGKTCGDCDDTSGAVRPGATETCNGVDDDCDGTVDEESNPPSLVVPSNIVVECAGPSGSVVSVGNASATDDCCGTNVTVTNDAPSVFPLGTTMVHWTARDCHGNTTTAVQRVTVADTTPPRIEVSLNPQVLSPADGSLRRVVADVRTVDVCSGQVNVVLRSITSNSANQGIAEADYGTADFAFLLRAQYPWETQNRLYRVTYAATDASGNTSALTSDVQAPRRR